MLLRERKRNRLQKYDYSQSGWYFITICSRNRIEYFGKIMNGKAVLNPYGEIVKQFWLEIPKHYQNVFLDEYIVMSNHIHGIIVIKNAFKNIHVGNRHACSLHRNIQLLPSIIGSFKSASSRFIHTSGLHSFQWQKSFYDHIIRNERSLWAIRQYIRNNPKHWEDDRNNVENLEM